MRFAGRISDWNDEKGFGFVVPNGGGDRAFVHISEFQHRSRRPVTGDLISYLPSKDQRGRLNAKEIRHAGYKIVLPHAPSRFPRAASGAVVLASVAVLAVVGIIPTLVAAAVFGLSLVAYFMYWLDKSAAKRSGQRIPENTLHLLGLVGGWPGALIAQQQFRHKTIKQPFQTIFWVTVVLNLTAVVLLVKTGIAANLVQSIGT